MNKIKKITIWGRIRDAAHALRGKPAHGITLGVEVKRCDQCDRGDCGQCFYKRKFEHWMGLPNCNDCLHNPHSSCGVCPAPGEDMRINCPLWEPKKGGVRH